MDFESIALNDYAGVFAKVSLNVPDRFAASRDLLHQVRFAAGSGC